MKFSSRRSPVARAGRVLEFYVPSFGAAMLSGAPSADDACCSATPLHGSGLSSGAPVAAATSAGVMCAHFGARYTWPRRCCAGCCTAVADHLLLETMGCAAVGRSFVMSSNSTEAWDAQEWAVIELQHHPCRLFGPYPLPSTHCRILRRGAVVALPHYGPTLPSLVTAREYRSYYALLYVHQVPGHGWARRATSSRGRRHVKCSGRWLCSNQRRRLK